MSSSVWSGCLCCAVLMAIAGCGAPPGTEEDDPLPKVFGNADVDMRQFQQRGQRKGGFRVMDDSGHAHDHPHPHPGEAGAEKKAAEGATDAEKKDSSAEPPKGDPAEKTQNDGSGPTQP